MARILTCLDTPSSISTSQPKQANNAEGTGFITAPQRVLQGNLVRAISPTMSDHFSQPRLFLNSLSQQEQQILVNAIRFELSNVKSATVHQNMITALNKVSNDLAIRVASVLGIAPPAPDPAFYHDNTTQGVNIFGVPLPSVATLTVGLLATAKDPASIQQAQAIQERFAQDRVNAFIVAESFVPGVSQTYSLSDASNFDSLVVVPGAEALFSPFQADPLFPLGRPSQILLDGYRWGKAVGSLGTGGVAFTQTGIPATAGVFINATSVETLVQQVEGGLATFRFLDRFPIDANAVPGAAVTSVSQAQTGASRQFVTTSGSLGLRSLLPLGKAVASFVGLSGLAHLFG